MPTSDGFADRLRTNVPISAHPGRSAADGNGETIPHCSARRPSMKRIGPGAPGISRLLFARVGLLLTASFLVAGVFIVALIGLGYHPI